MTNRTIASAARRRVERKEFSFNVLQPTVIDEEEGKTEFVIELPIDGAQRDAGCMHSVDLDDVQRVPTCFGRDLSHRLKSIDVVIDAGFEQDRRRSDIVVLIANANNLAPPHRGIEQLHGLPVSVALVVEEVILEHEQEPDRRSLRRAG